MRLAARHRHEKNPAGIPPGSGCWGWRLTPARGSRCCYAFSSLRFSLLATSVLAWLFVTLFQFQALEESVILNFLLQNAHGLFDVIVDDFDLDFLQQYRPFRSVGR